MSRKSRMGRHHDEAPVVARVPVIPMLDMAFQLLAFGLYCFDLNPDKIEGQLSLTLPKTGAAADTPLTDPTKIEEASEDFTIRVTADGSGRVSAVELTTTRVTQTEPLPKDAVALAANLKDRVEQKAASKEPAPKLDMQFDPDLNYQLVFDLLSAADKANFKKVTPNLLGAPPKPKEPMAPMPP
jgi:biopolymer transport protein ExbD